MTRSVTFNFSRRYYVKHNTMLHLHLVVGLILIKTIHADPTGEYYSSNQFTDVMTYDNFNIPSFYTYYYLIPLNYNDDLSIWSYLSNPINLFSVAVSKIFSLVTWILYNSTGFFLGIVMVFGLCTFTPFCNIKLHKKEMKTHIPIYDNIECFFQEAYRKYSEMQDYVG